MDLTSTSAEPISSATKAQSTAPSGGSGDFQTFLTLLTAQMRNQDPMKPMDSTEFVAQLASFSAVEQQIQTNDKLSELIGLFSTGATSPMADWIEKEVRHKGSANFDEIPIEVNVAIHPNAETAVMIVRNSNHQIVYQTLINPAQSTYDWNGQTTDGDSAPIGSYNFEVESYVGDNVIQTEVAEVFSLVTEVRIDNGTVILLFEDGSTMNADDATSMRLPNG